MFEFVRSHSRLMLGLIVVLIVPSFVFFGLQGYSRMTEGSQATVAKVNGQAITQAEWDFAHQRAIDRMRQQAPGIDVRLLDTPQMRRETLDMVVRERVLLAAANDEHLFPTDERLHRLFTTDPQFAGARNPDGSVNRDLLAAQGLSSEQFAQQLGTQFGMQQVLAGVNASVVAPPAVADASLDALLQQREIQLQRFDATAYRDKVSPTDAELETFYKAHERDFRAPEQARIEYVVLDVDTVGKDVSVPEADLQRYYEENASRYTVAEERRARHILIESDASAPAAERAKAKARAEELLKQVRAQPASFAELAKKNSQDTGSAAQGGDLDWFARGAMVKPFEDAVFAMKPGEISNAVESDFGYHIIQLNEVRGGSKEPFASVRPKIEAEVRKSLAQRRYAEAAEQFSNMVYEQPDSLQPVIDKFKLDKRTGTVQRQPAPGAVGVLASGKLLEAVFGDDALRNKRNTDAVEVGPSQLVSARVVQHEPEHTLPLAEVRDRVRAAVVQAQAAALAHKEGQARLAAVKADAAATLSPAQTVSRATAQTLPREVLDAALGADPKALPATVGVDLG
ncbi:MAG: peptidylprolyl isomerase, partial [Rubrivivax sp.]